LPNQLELNQKMKKILILIILSLLSFSLSHADITKGTKYQCALTMFDGNDHPTVKFPLKILKSYDDDFVVYSHGSIVRNELLVFGKLYNNALLGYLYSDKIIQVEYFYYDKNQLIFYNFDIDKDQQFPYPGGESLFIVEEEAALKGFTQRADVKVQLTYDQLNLEKKIFHFIDNHIKQIMDNEKNHLFITDLPHKCRT